MQQGVAWPTNELRWSNRLIRRNSDGSRWAAFLFSSSLCKVNMATLHSGKLKSVDSPHRYWRKMKMKMRSLSPCAPCPLCPPSFSCASCLCPCPHTYPCLYLHTCPSTKRKCRFLSRWPVQWCFFFKWLSDTTSGIVISVPWKPSAESHGGISRFSQRENSLMKEMKHPQSIKSPNPHVDS